MRNHYTKNSILFLVIILVALIGCKSAYNVKKTTPDTGPDIKAVNERLVASDVTSTKPFWCGPAHMLAYSKNDGGLLLQNIDTGEVITVSDDPYNRMVGCTNDGKWFVYLDVNAYHKGNEEHPEYGNEMVRYEVATGKSEAFAVAYSADSWAKPYKLTAEEYGNNFSSLNVDSDGRLYFYTANDLFSDPNINTLLYRCTLKNKELSCEKVFEYEDIGSYEVLSGGDIIFNRIYDDKCIHIATPGQAGADCLLDRSHTDRYYQSIRLRSLSPNRKFLAFVRSVRYFQDDLFIVELVNE